MVVSDFNQFSQADSQILHPGTRLLFRYWETVRSEKAAPRRQDLDLRQIKSLLPNLVIIEKRLDTGAYKWRLAGTDVCQLFGREITATDALFLGDDFEKSTVKRMYDSVRTRLQPCLLRYRLITEHQSVIGVEQLGLPLLNATESQAFVFGGIFPFHEPARQGHKSITGFELTSARTIWTEHLPGDKLLEKLNNSTPVQGGLRLIHGGRRD